VEASKGSVGMQARRLVTERKMRGDVGGLSREKEEG
jgi:hypothetical protein